MGAALDFRVYENEATARANWRQDRLDAAVEDGSSYSGAINQLDDFYTLEAEVATVDDAVNYIEENHDKYDAPLAVPTADGKVVVGGWCSS